MGKVPPNNIIIGENVFRNLNDTTKEKFPLKDKFILFETGEIYSTHMTNKKK